MSQPPVWILLTTYKRLSNCLDTIRKIKHNLIYSNLGWIVCDDNSGDDYLKTIVDEIGYSYSIVSRSVRAGVGAHMNWGLQQIWNRESELVLTMEDDWSLDVPLDLQPYVNLLMNHNEYGMIRFGYLAPNLLGYLVSEEGKLFWRLEPNGETYRFAGHPNLKHKRFFEQYGYYDEGLAPGNTELSMCGKVNAKPDGPYIVYPAECGQWGFWGHTGGISLADVPVE